MANSKKIAVLILAYNESEYIRQCINQWSGLVDKITVLIPTMPWLGSPQADDGTVMKARRAGAEVIIQNWKSEAEQRTWGCARLYDYDYVITCDADEFYTKEDREKIIYTLNNGEEQCYRANNVITYWKYNFVITPPDTHKPIIAVAPKKIKFIEHRMPMEVSEDRLTDLQPIINVSIHHFSWSKPDHKIKAKIENFSHADIVKPNWYEKKWLNWTEDTEDIRPYGIEKSRAIKQEPPQEIKELIK
jgi:hypothetical protein